MPHIHHRPHWGPSLVHVPVGALLGPAWLLVMVLSEGSSGCLEAECSLAEGCASQRDQLKAGCTRDPKTDHGLQIWPTAPSASQPHLENGTLETVTCQELS